MFQRLIIGWFLFMGSGLFSQELSTPYINKKIAPQAGEIVLDTVNINRAFFKILTANDSLVGTEHYEVDFLKASLRLKNPDTFTDSLTVRYLKFPEFLTKTYSIFDDKRVVPNDAGLLLYQGSTSPLKTPRPFDGLTTSGSITRGVTVGNNQNAVVNSNLDLQITGKISDKVSLRASIQDSNIPIQEGGYSQRLDEFDQIFIELFADDWNIRAGDLFLENRRSRLLNFNKKVQGVSTQFGFGSPKKRTEITAAAALVRGQYARSNFVGQEGNQGPYKLRGNNNELYVLVISGSERVFVNGILLQRGENNHYMIDYNAGEIIFTSLFPITSEMRISIEYQYTDRNYTRIVAYGGISHQREHWQVQGYVYNENDIKNQPLQQNLSQEQVQILQQAGDDLNLMNAPSAYEDSFSENKILYRKIFVGGIEVFEFSNDPSETLYNVRFTMVGNNQGNYILANNQAVGRIYAYVPPVNGVPQGNYDPIIRLVAPTKIQLATVLGSFNPSEKTTIAFEVGMSNNDQNLFSNLDNDNNQGYAGHFEMQQQLFGTERWSAQAFAEWQYVHRNFRTIERLFNIEFDRDWNLSNPMGTQSLLKTGMNFDFKTRGKAQYSFENLSFSESFEGQKHSLQGVYRYKKWSLQTQGSAMVSDGTFATSNFIRNHTQTRYHFHKNWIGGQVAFERVKETIKETQALSALSQNFTEWGAFVGRGDSTKVFVELGLAHRVNDSLVNQRVQRVNQSLSYYLKSRLLQTDQSDLSLFVNYRTLHFEDPNQASQPSLNSRLLYNDRFFKQMIQSTTAFETSSGTIAQQEFTYLEVEPGQGVYMWIDYNENGIQELEEFEVAPFPDQARYVRVFLPNQIFIQTHQNKFSQSITLNPLAWQNEKGIKKLASYFYNQTSYVIDRKIRRDGSNFDLNPFAVSDDDLLGLAASFRNSLFYNRGKQKHSVTYTYVSNRTRNLLSIGSQEAQNLSHQWQYTHLIKSSWLAVVNARSGSSRLTSENFSLKNFNIDQYSVAPKLSYLFSKQANLDVFFEWQEKTNTIGDLERLQQSRLGTSFTYAGAKQFTISGAFTWFDNQFDGFANSPVAFQMLEGLQPGKNQTWQLLVQKNLTQYLDINVNYQGRKSETSKAIHTGNIQLRAFF